VETVEEFLARGGRIQKLEHGATKFSEEFEMDKRRSMEKHYKRAGDAIRNGRRKYRDGKGVEA